MCKIAYAGYLKAMAVEAAGKFFCVENVVVYYCGRKGTD